jgi:hypothetical protein
MAARKVFIKLDECPHGSLSGFVSCCRLMDTSFS